MKIPNIKFKFKTYIVGGFVRDYLLGVESKDLDLCMVAPSFEDMEQAVKEAGGEIYLSTPQYLTIRCKIPELGAVDVALARKDGDYSDGRRPDETFIASDIESDLKRRCCSMNAIAIDLSNGDIIDPFKGVKAIKDRCIRMVGNPEDRIREDFLRILRYFRFSITKNMIIDAPIQELMCNKDIVDGLDKISKERIREELFKCFKYNTLKTLKKLEEYSVIREKIFKGKMWLEPTFKN